MHGEIYTYLFSRLRTNLIVIQTDGIETKCSLLQIENREFRDETQ